MLRPMADCTAASNQFGAELAHVRVRHRGIAVAYGGSHQFTSEEFRWKLTI
jgi:hypothetical protein